MTYPSLSEDEAEQQRGLRMSAAMHELAELVSRAMVEAEARGAGRPAWTPHVLQGPARAAIERALRRLEADVVVLGTRSGSTAAFMFLGSIAGDVLRAARCDVLLVPPARRRN
jgi:nucleotide-binding universal stress UspA family protein